MTVFWSILWNNVIPLSVMIALGVTLQRFFSLDIRTLSKLNFYLFSPAIIFRLLYTTEISLKIFGQTLLYFGLFFILQYIVVELAVRLRGHQGGMRGAMRNSVLFYNSANYAIPLNQFVFAGNPFTLSVQVIVMVMQALLPNTYGIYSVNAHKSSMKTVIRTILALPVIYVIPVGLLLRGCNITLPDPVVAPIDYLADAFIGTALITLGVQLGSMKWTLSGTRLKDVWLSSFLRLIIGPLTAWFVVWMLGFEGLLAQALILSSAVPTSLSSVLLAVEFDNEAEFSSQTVLVSTVLSVITVTLVIYALQI
ncbi:AEC family transporter [Paenibacillus spongiae]|uniref:AEC family transporter n=1 Tax=Paenibacillus spongiae TaxID=2909671 RepID=A0ABY5SD65_9BACL|nr:AEC family transporter [Paenibacillus spongiae]UVI31714.1 AEC family transporter [Paenibacillus spongiae]